MVPRISIGDRGHCRQDPIGKSRPCLVSVLGSAGVRGEGTQRGSNSSSTPSILAEVASRHERSESYDRQMTEKYGDDTSHLELDPDAWVVVASQPRKGRLYGFGDSWDTTPVISSCASSSTPLTCMSAFTMPSGGERDFRHTEDDKQRAAHHTGSGHPPLLGWHFVTGRSINLSTGLLVINF
ncbi:hypothetical protein Taro_006119 [Colocasia esculenta]|uniref:Uncharacterized protein n=1 Tax=Colocasia esculenta TaxID=4460 RepID=A0A843TWI0_COLES|nr:hypothetical protein [Colocasia esculenta]